MNFNNLGIICDLNKTSGLGHFKRMSYLENQLKKRGQKSLFLFDIEDRKFVRKFLKHSNVKFFSKNILQNNENLKSFLLKHKISNIIIDSYKLNFSFEEKLIRCGIFVISIDDHLKKHASNVVITNRNDIKKIFKKQIWLSGSKYVLATCSKNKIEKKKKRNYFKILLHAGGYSYYRLNKNFTESAFKAVNNSKNQIEALCSSKESKKYILKLAKKYNMGKRLKILQFSNNFKKMISKYDIVAGPAGTTTYEAILAGALPFSIPLKNDGRDSLNTWNSIGHLMHLSSKEKTNLNILDKSWVFIFNNYNKLLKNLNNNKNSIDGLGPKRVAEKIIFFLKNKSRLIYPSNKKNNHNKFDCNKCEINEARTFLKARNQKQNRMLSSKPNHKITWPEHLNWWFNRDCLKYSLKKNDITVAFHWIKIVKDKFGKFVIAGWFLYKNPKEKLKIASKILSFQFNAVKKNYKTIQWIINFKNGQKFVERLNKKIGFKNASQKSVNRICDFYSLSSKEFKFMEMTL